MPEAPRPKRAAHHNAMARVRTRLEERRHRKARLGRAVESGCARFVAYPLYSKSGIHPQCAVFGGGVIARRDEFSGLMRNHRIP